MLKALWLTGTLILATIGHVDMTACDSMFQLRSVIFPICVSVRITSTTLPMFNQTEQQSMTKSFDLLTCSHDKT